jgi:hypothetical protein
VIRVNEEVTVGDGNQTELVGQENGIIDHLSQSIDL